MSAPERIARATRLASRQLATLSFAPPVACIYDPMQYAWRPHRLYLRRFAGAPKRFLMLGMNPGPFGMAQTGVPFGDVAMVRDWMGIEAPVTQPPQKHPKRPVLGFDCTRSEVSGSRFWGWARDRFGSAERFFAAGFVHNYCPLVFMADSGRNITPDKLPRGERDALYALCDRLLRIVIESLRPRELVAVGAFAEQRLGPLAAALGLGVRRIPHPSPASPVANKGWAEAVDAVLADLLPSP